MSNRHESTISDNHTDTSRDLVARAAEPGVKGNGSATGAAAHAIRPPAAAVRKERFAKRHPYVTATAMFGLGACVGALAWRLFGPQPTVSGLLGIEVLPSKGKHAASRCS